MTQHQSYVAYHHLRDEITTPPRCIFVFAYPVVIPLPRGPTKHGPANVRVMRILSEASIYIWARLRSLSEPEQRGDRRSGKDTVRRGRRRRLSANPCNPIWLEQVGCFLRTNLRCSEEKENMYWVALSLSRRIKCYVERTSAAFPESCSSDFFSF